MRWLGWTSGILGLWLLLSPFLGLGPKGNFWNDLIVGVVVAIVGFGMVQAASWQGWTAGFLGLWLIIAAFIPGVVTGAGLLWNDIIVGLIIAIAGFTALSATKPSRMAGDMHQKMAH
jgi:hypothetical protein